jgi:hypothetical protein
MENILPEVLDDLVWPTSREWNAQFLECTEEWDTEWVRQLEHKLASEHLRRTAESFGTRLLSMFNTIPLSDAS